MNKRAFDVLLFLAASPVLVVKLLFKAYKRYRLFAVARESAITCECGADVWLVGLWRCSCGFTYRGHLLRACPVCLAVPQVVRCYACGVTTKLPEPGG